MRKIGSILLLFFAVSMMPAQESIGTGQRGSGIDQEHTKWVDGVIRSILTIKPGATRKDLLKVFTEEGGISSRTHRKYVYKECPYIKVDVEFAPVGSQNDALAEMPDDTVIAISRPYLEYSIFD